MIWGVFQPGSHWYWVIIVGIPFAIIYYIVFKRYLTKKNISIDVAEDEEEVDTSLSMDERQKAKAYRIIRGLGGVENVVAANNCLTRLREVNSAPKFSRSLEKNRKFTSAKSAASLLS